MARLSLTVQNIIAKYPTLPLTGKEILLVHNANAGAQTVTISSVVDPYKRTGDITTYSVGIGEYAAFPPFPKDGWAQSDGYLYFAASAADVNFAVLRLPD